LTPLNVSRKNSADEFHNRLDGDRAAAETRRQQRDLHFHSAFFCFSFALGALRSWALPQAIILIVPMCLFSSIYGVGSARGEQHLHQIGFVVLVRLACKNAILIVEFAKQIQDRDRRITSPPRSKPAASACVRSS
jgi:multidrug efflux pump subunit AcrB